MATEAKVTNVRETDAALGRIPGRIEDGARAADRQTGAEMVREMQARAPVRSGELRQGITERQEGNATIVEATALRDDFDYARAVEFGRHADAAFFDDRPGGGGADADPFFLPVAYDVLSGREPEMDGIADQAGQAEGFGR